MPTIIRFRPLEPRKKRRVNRAFNCYIKPRSSDIDHVDRERRETRNTKWIKKGAPL